MFAGMVRAQFRCNRRGNPVNLFILVIKSKLITICQIFRKEPFFHGHDNYDQVSVSVELCSRGVMQLIYFT